MIKTKILFSARDVAAAYEIKNFVTFFSKKNYTINIVAMDPAYSILKNILSSVYRKKLIKLKILKSKNYKKILFDYSDKLIKKTESNLIITGLSMNNIGIDEALIHQGKKKNILTFSIQDFPGDVNKFNKFHPDYYIVMDKISADLTKKKTKSKVFVIGHQINKNLLKLKIKRYRRIESQKNILICSQPFSNKNFFLRTIKNFSKEIFKLKKEFNYYYRPHPGENKKIPYLINKFFKKNKIKINEVKSEDLYKDLLNKDLIVTCFSSIIIDFAKINAVSNKPLGMILSLMYDKELKFYYKKINRLNFLPFEKMDWSSN